MAAYSAVACLRQTLKQLLDSDQFPLHFQKPQIENLHEKVSSLQSSLDRILSVPKSKEKAMKKVETKIREAIYTAQDKVEYTIIGHPSSQISDKVSWREIADAISDVEEKAKMLAEVINNDPRYPDLFSQEPVQPKNFSSRGRVKKITGQERDFAIVSDLLVQSEDKQRLVILFTGLPGLGKTTLARNIYNSREIQRNFNIRAWVTVSQEYNFREIYSNLLSSKESKNYEAGHYAVQGDEEALFNCLHQELYNLKYLIVVDDLWDTRAWEKISLVLPDKENGSRILLTSRIRSMVESINKDGYIHTMQPPGLEDSWKLLCYKVFDEVEGEEDITKACLPHLKEIGRSIPPFRSVPFNSTISSTPKGLPLSLTVVGGLLLQERVVAKYWKIVEEDVSGAAATKGEESYMDILSLSYTYLPAKLKACFLYMGAFPLRL